MTGEPNRFSIRLSRDMDGLRRLGVWVDAISESLALSVQGDFALRLCLEETIANLVLHGVPASIDASDADIVTIAVVETDDRLCLTVEDRCLPYDPRSAAEPPAVTDAKTARVGGLGIQLLRRYAKAISYETDGSANRLILATAR